MTAPNTCQTGYTFSQDLTPGPNVDPSWTIDQVSSQDGVIYKTGTYQHSGSVGISSPAISYIHKVLGGVSSIFQATLSWDYSFTGGGYSTSSATPFIFIPDGAGTLNGYEINIASSGYPDVTVTVKLIVRDTVGNIEYTQTLFTHTDNVGTFPVSNSGSGILKVIQISGNNTQVYWNNTLVFTTTSDLHSGGTQAKIGLAKWIVTDTNFFTSISNISYVGISGLGNDCPFPDIGTLPDNFTFGISHNDLIRDDGLETAVAISLFTDRRASLEDSLPDASGNLRGWWADITMGSKLWLLERSKTIDKVLSDASDYIKEALQWMIDDGVADKVECFVIRVRGNQATSGDELLMTINIFKPNALGTPSTFKYFYNWKNQLARGMQNVLQ